MKNVSMGLAERALEHFKNKTTDQAESTLEIPLAAYRDPDRYADEVDGFRAQRPWD